MSDRDKQYSAYVQDNWDVNPKLQINLGLRWDREEVPAYLNYVTPQCSRGDQQALLYRNLAAAMHHDGDLRPVLATDAPGAPGININDYISNGQNRKARNNFSPRSASPTISAATIHWSLFGGYARAYNRNLFGTLALETTKFALNDNPRSFPVSPIAGRTRAPA